MRRPIRIAVLAASLLLPLAAPSLLAGPWEITFSQAGVEMVQVGSGTVFDVNGSGFHNRVLPVKVCLSGAQCQLAEPDQDGNFMVQRVIATPGTYTVTVHQARDLNLTEWRLKVWKDITITE